jgi:hypothetical protein
MGHHRVGVYYSPGHHRPSDLEYIRALQPPWVVILEPDVMDIHQVHQAAPVANIVLRYWSIDDSNGQRQADAVANPEWAAKRDVQDWVDKLAELELKANTQGLVFPRSQIVIAGVPNEMDSYNFGDKIRLYSAAILPDYTARGIRTLVFRFSVGHPAPAGEKWDWAYFGKLAPLVGAGLPDSAGVEPGLWAGACDLVRQPGRHYSHAVVSGTRHL